MKLINRNYEYVFHLIDGNHFCITIENPLIFRTYVTDLLNQIEGGEGKFILSEGIEEKEIDKNISMITDYLRFDPIDKKVSNKINLLLKNFVVDEILYEKTTEVVSTIEKYAISIIDDFPYSLSYDKIDVNNLLKILNLKITVEYTSLLEKIIEYMKLLHGICGISVFILLNISSFLSPQELEYLIEEANLQKHNLIFIESHNNQVQIPYTKNIIIDKDGCEIF